MISKVNFIMIATYIAIIAPIMVFSQQTYQVQGSNTSKIVNSVVEDASHLILEDLKIQGKKRVLELIKMAKNNKNDNIAYQFAGSKTISNPNDSNDKALYANPVVNEIDKELILEYRNFFRQLEKECGNMKKTKVLMMESPDEPIGHSFRFLIPGKIQKGDMYCNHFTIGFRRDLSGNLMVNEWYVMPMNTDCQ